MEAAPRKAAKRKLPMRSLLGCVAAAEYSVQQVQKQNSVPMLTAPNI
jgi:hypothetical protein